MASLGPVLWHCAWSAGRRGGIKFPLLHLTMNKTNRMITVAHPLDGFGTFALPGFSLKAAGETRSPAEVARIARREPATAAQAARLIQVFGRGWSSKNPRVSTSLSKSAA